MAPPRPSSRPQSAADPGKGRRRPAVCRPAGGGQDLAATVPGAGFRGNKAALPSKPCVACGLAMTWRRRWARNWAEVKYCSDACRRRPLLRG